ncbi:hypothetical protein SAMN05216355_1338 [Actinomyces ruminicola]|uniref:Uncharacterized protein n=1 Tax=Actinomyces ruminicola TaxID=332524 RepID=A0A1H0FLE5_9ACTO|nr:hypothetical protein SAMN05216355_1338 [Actinomyces ruminicola]
MASVSVLAPAVFQAVGARLTGYWCPVCGGPRVPYRGDDGVHPCCYAEARKRGLVPSTDPRSTRSTTEGSSR